jgi:hypothetical protein
VRNTVTRSFNSICPATTIVIAAVRTVIVIEHTLLDILSDTEERKD